MVMQVKKLFPQVVTNSLNNKLLSVGVKYEQQMNI